MQLKMARVYGMNIQFILIIIIIIIKLGGGFDEKLRHIWVSHV